MAEILSMNDTGSKITICNDIMDENFYIKGIIFVMMCHEYKPKLVTTFPPQISLCLYNTCTCISYSFKCTYSNYLTVLNYLQRLMGDACTWFEKKIINDMFSLYLWFDCNMYIPSLYMILNFTKGCKILEN